MENYLPECLEEAFFFFYTSEAKHFIWIFGLKLVPTPLSVDHLMISAFMQPPDYTHWIHTKDRES